MKQVKAILQGCMVNRDKVRVEVTGYPVTLFGRPMIVHRPLLEGRQLDTGWAVSDIDTGRKLSRECRTKALAVESAVWAGSATMRMYTQCTDVDAYIADVCAQAGPPVGKLKTQGEKP